MGEVLSFNKKKFSSSSNKTKASSSKAKSSSASSQPSQHEASVDQPKLKLRPAKKKETLNSESIKVWWISQEFDDLIKKAVLDKHIPVEELAAVMAHRLGTLLMTSERSPELTLFCMKVISKITNQPHPGSNAS